METEIIKSKRSYQVVESQTYTDSINFFAVKKHPPVFVFLFVSKRRNTCGLCGICSVVLYLTAADKNCVLRERGKGLERLERVLCFRNMYWDGSGIGYLFQMSRLVKCVMTPRHWPQILLRRDKTTSHGYLL